MASQRIWTAALVVIGDEILSGRTQDKNVSQIALWLNIQGIRLAEVRVVPDVESAIVEAVFQAIKTRRVWCRSTSRPSSAGTRTAITASLRMPERKPTLSKT